MQDREATEYVEENGKTAKDSDIKGKKKPGETKPNLRVVRIWGCARESR